MDCEMLERELIASGYIAADARMDIKSAVQIASVGNLPSQGILELEASREYEMPGPLPLDPPMVTSQELDEVANSLARKYRDALKNRVRQAGEARRLDQDFARNAAVVDRMMREAQIARWLIWASAVVAVALIVAVAMVLGASQ